MSFCERCDQSMREDLTGAKLMWACTSCEFRAPARPEETLLDSFQLNIASDPSRYDTRLAHAGDDDANLKVERPCPGRCAAASRVMSRVFVGDTETAVDVCEECGGQFPAATATAAKPKAARGTAAAKGKVKAKGTSARGKK
jgi:DNA-directed RNA polymerase subunit M/transcription elongation factor TFIIS